MVDPGVDGVFRFWKYIWDLENGDSVMLFIVAEEGYDRTGVYDFRDQKSLIELNHGRIVFRIVRRTTWANAAGL